VCCCFKEQDFVSKASSSKLLFVATLRSHLHDGQSVVTESPTLPLTPHLNAARLPSTNHAKVQHPDVSASYMATRVEEYVLACIIISICTLVCGFICWVKKPTHQRGCMCQLRQSPVKRGTELFRGEHPKSVRPAHKQDTHSASQYINGRMHEARSGNGDNPTEHHLSTVPVVGIDFESESDVVVSTLNCRQHN